MTIRLTVGETVPDFNLNDLNGHPYRLSDYRGKIVLVNFWSAECPYVERVDRLILPMLEAWGDRVVYLPVNPNANESPDQMKKSAGERGMATVLWDDQGQLANAWGAEITPEFFLIDPEGVLRYHGAFDDINFRQKEPTRCYICETVEALLAGRLPDTDHAAPYGCTIVRFTNLVA